MSSSASYLFIYYAVYLCLFAVTWKLILFEYKNGSFSLFFWLTLMVIYVVPAATDPFLGYATVEYSNLYFDLRNNWSVVWAHLYALAFSTLYFGTRLKLLKGANGANLHLYRFTGKRISNYFTRNYVLTLSGVAIFGLVMGLLSLYVVGGMGHVMDASFTTMIYESDVNYLRLGVYFLVAASGGAFLAYLTRQWTSMFVISGCMVAYFFTSFSRTMLSYAFLPFLVYFLFRFKRFRYQVVFIGLIPLLYLGSTFLLFVRYQGSFLNVYESLVTGAVFDDLYWNLMNAGGETQLRFIYYFFIEGDWYSKDILFGHNYIRLMMLLIPPEFSFGYKPELLDAIIFRIFFSNNPAVAYADNAALHALAFTNAYLNFGVLGLLLGVFWGYVVHKFHVLLHAIPEHMRTAMIPALTVGAIKAARGAVYSSCAVVVGALLLLTLFHFITKFFSLPSRRSPIAFNPPGPPEDSVKRRAVVG